MKLGVKKIMIKEVLKYQGNSNYICILCLNDKNKMFVFYALTGKLSIETESEREDFEINNYRMIYSLNQRAEIKIPIIETKQFHLFHIVEVENEKEYEHICAVVESLV